MSEQYTKEEMRQMFLVASKNIAHYWSQEERKTDGNEDMILSAFFSLFNIFDGTSGSFPCAIDLVLRPHPDNKQYCIDEGEKWVEDGMAINDDCYLHDMIFKD